jgi:hypothetical protein
MFESSYSNSWALCIGINDYKCQPKLKTAVNDANKVADLLIRNFAFPKDNVTLLLDSDATKENIIKALHNFIYLTNTNDRVFLFFAGHGSTIVGYKEVGFLIPVEGNDHSSSLIRYEEFTKVSDLIPAKHIFFVFDACFSGLAFTRSIPLGSSRFMLDMLSRKSRQAIASGKANQPVADEDGPISNHSLFAGYLIKGMEGEAKNEQSILSASTLMHYLYQKVANDSNSHQTPHYGHFEGDGDFIFEHPYFNNPRDKVEVDVLYTAFEQNEQSPIQRNNLEDKIKLYLSEDKFRIKLEELVVSELKYFSNQFNENELPNNNGSEEEEYLINTLDKLEYIVKDIQSCLLLIAYYGNQDQKNLINKIFSIMCNEIGLKKEKVLYNELRWFSIIWLLYSTGTILIYKEDYKAFHNLLHIEVPTFTSNYGFVKLLRSYGSAFGSINSYNIFKQMKFHERHYTPISEYVFRKLQPILEDIFYIGSNYENLFDKYEIIIALEYLSNLDWETEFIWAPIGRFGWKNNRGMYSPNPYKNFVNEIKSAKNGTKYLNSGLFKADIDFIDLLDKKLSEFIVTLNWY